MRTNTGKRSPVTRTAYQEPGEDAPSVVVPSKPAPAAKVQRNPAPEPSYTPVEPPMPQMSQPLYREHLAWDTDAGTCATGECMPQDCWISTWAKFDYLLWWRSGMDLPPLVTTAAPGTAQANAGLLGLPTTSNLYGGEREEFPVRPGGRLELGMWFDRSECLGIGGRFFRLGDADATYSALSTGSPILAIPFTEGFNGTNNARLIGFPGTFNGNLNVTMSSEFMGGDAYLRTEWCRPHWGRIDLIGGYQFVRINEGLTIDSTVSDNLGATNRIIDNFQTRNEFHGGQIGFLANVDQGCWSLDMLAKVGLGNMQEEVTISGQGITTVGSSQATIASGLFTQPTNIGTYSRNQFVAIPELGVNVAWHATQCLDLNVGYTAIYYSSVIRPNGALDTTVNTTQVNGGTLSGPARPAFSFDETSMVVHGLSFGATFKW
ncbi:MAG TPA: BBP7 family outer membrane beta-barrel protein [Pirellulaceae bacterium]|nr:BBP7 family outer membrane beta-barrel protein [Pirellulaceae bacterium]